MVSVFGQNFNYLVVMMPVFGQNYKFLVVMVPIFPLNSKPGRRGTCFLEEFQVSGCNGVCVLAVFSSFWL